VANDEREESGLRAVLNFGHTIGHALEAATDYVRFRHGEAVAAGMVAAACIGEVAGVTAPQARHAVAESVRGLGLPAALPGDVDRENILSLLSLDKKAHAGRARWVLLRTLGEVAPGAPCFLEETVVRSGLALQASVYGSAVGQPA
jgi:3-dehydroquinate synthase